MKEIIIKILKLLHLYELPQTPASISKNFKRLDEAAVAKLNASLIENMFAGRDFNNVEVKEDMDAHMYGRLEKFRHRHIPFLDKITGLSGKKILEIGCGSGSSSIALAEQGARVYGIDVDEPSLKIAADRAALFNLNGQISFQYGNAVEVDKLYEPEQFDVAIFFASIEHMTHHERIASLKAAWKVLKKGGALCILGTPNRLWFYDMHTAFMPFYMWLPDDLAFAYSKFSPREKFNEFYKRGYNESELEFLRWGRGVSFHELEVAIKPAAQLKVLGDLHSFERPKTMLQQLSYRRTDEYKFKKILAKNGPANLSPAFYEYYLDFAVLKDE